MKRFSVTLLVLSIFVAYGVRILNGSSWDETVVLETLGSALGLVFFPGLIALGIFYVFLFWKFKKFDQNSYEKICWGIWGLAVLSKVVTSFSAV